jgi:hypothetical protein
MITFCNFEIKKPLDWCISADEDFTFKQLKYEIPLEHIYPFAFVTIKMVDQ